MSDPKKLIAIDTDIEADQNSWESLPDGFRLQIQTGPDHELLIDNEDFLLIQ
jgi:hypothetical protein